MSLFDSLKQKLNDVLREQAANGSGPAAEAQAANPGMFDGLVALVRDHGVAAIVQKFKAAGLSEAVSSWVSHGKNLPITPDQLRAALGPEAIESLARKAGIDPGQASTLLAKFLPNMIDHLTPNGKVEEAPASESAPAEAGPSLF
jgi:uncharacterized protein YidB (DUF937 family)